MRRDRGRRPAPRVSDSAASVPETADHVPVMTREVLEALAPGPGTVMLDCTLGGAGHARQLLDRSAPDGILVGIDQDAATLEIARERLAGYGDRVRLFHLNFEEIDRLPALCGIGLFDGILFDLGVSSFQLGDPKRGFSFAKEGPLDMRMNEDQTLTAAHIVNRYSEQDLLEIFRRFGEEREASRIVRRIVETRRRGPILTTVELAGVIQQARRFRHYHRVHPATQSFQALRIAVNRELDVLQTGLEKATGLLRQRARMCVISFHSLEDRIVKHFFRESPDLEGVTRKPLVAGDDERDANPRARSAKLRVAEKIAQGEEDHA